MERTTVAEAAKQLEVTQEAIRARIRRGTIKHERGEDGKTYVYLTEEGTHSQQMGNTVVNGVVNDYITSLKSEIESLKEDRERWIEEARRKDTIIMALTNRIPELEAPSEATESTVTASEEENRGDVPREGQRRPWWRRVFTS